MKPADFPIHINALISATPNPPWWILAALGCIHNGHIHYIKQRRSDDLYLARMWLTPPKPSTEDGGQFESGGSVLLHWFACGDDDQALHDHPWSFATTILAGGYWEHLPPMAWVREERIHGPAWDARRIWRSAGDEVIHGIHDLHCVADPAPDTFTLVRTGARVRDWGFHPEGRPWMHRAVYLNREQAANV